MMINIDILEAEAKLDMNNSPLFERKVSYGHLLNKGNLSTLTIEYSQKDNLCSDLVQLTMMYNTAPPKDHIKAQKVGDYYVTFEFIYGFGPQAFVLGEKGALVVDAIGEAFKDAVLTYDTMKVLVDKQAMFTDIAELALRIGTCTQQFIVKGAKPTVLIIDNEYTVALGKIWRNNREAVRQTTELYPSYDETTDICYGRPQDRVYWWFCYHHRGIKLVEY